MNKSWKPKRIGATYCSPACGSGCTWEEYQTANKQAAVMVKSCGPAFRPKVFENMGWHATAELSGTKNRSKGMTVHRNGTKSCTAYFHDGNFVGRGRTGEAAVKAVVKQAIRMSKAIHATLAALGVHK
jgi:hypothetical protein